MDKLQTPEEFAKEKYFSACSFGGNVHVSFYNNLIRDLKNRDAAVRATLVEALEKIANWTPGIVYGSAPVDFQEIARAALEAAKGE